MTDHTCISRDKEGHEPDPAESGQFGGGPRALGVYDPGFRYKDESLRFFRSCVGDEIYNKAMNSEAGHAHHYAVARAFLNQSDWVKFVWIEQYGTLDGFPGV